MPGTGAVVPARRACRGRLPELRLHAGAHQRPRRPLFADPGRINKGGHGISEEDIERRYVETFKNLKDVLKYCDLAANINVFLQCLPKMVPSYPYAMTSP